jgi:hypothetical protein
MPGHLKRKESQLRNQFDSFSLRLGMLNGRKYQRKAYDKKGKQNSAYRNKFLRKRFEKTHALTMERLCILNSVLLDFPIRKRKKFFLLLLNYSPASRELGFPLTNQETVSLTLCFSVFTGKNRKTSLR